MNSGTSDGRKNNEKTCTIPSTRSNLGCWGTVGDVRAMAMHGAVRTDTSAACCWTLFSCTHDYIARVTFWSRYMGRFCCHDVIISGGCRKGGAWMLISGVDVAGFVRTASTNRFTNERCTSTSKQARRARYRTIRYGPDIRYLVCRTLAYPLRSSGQRHTSKYHL